MSNPAEPSNATFSSSLRGTQMQPPRRIIRVIGVPLDLGASRRGVDMGPSAVRVAGLAARLESLGHQVTDGGNIRVEIAETQAAGSENARFLKQIAETCTRTAEAVVKTLEDGMTPLVLGGDHSVAAGSVSGVAHFYRRQSQRIGVLWIDAHSDINTPDSSPSGNVHGMPLAALLGSNLKVKACDAHQQKPRHRKCLFRRGRLPGGRVSLQVGRVNCHDELSFA